MRLSLVLMALTFAVMVSFALAEDNAPGAVTALRSYTIGPERPGNLPAVTVPADNPQTTAKIRLGKNLYFDTRLSKDNTVSCATCHDPAMGWSDIGPTSKGINDQMGGRRAPPVSNAAYSALQFWDGRAPSLEEQAKGPIANPIEMGNTHDVMLRTVDDIPGYVQDFADVFGPGPITLDQVAQAIAAYERTVVTTDSPFDRFVRGDQSSLTKLEKQGLEIFNGKGHCAACHWGSYFSDGRFHNLGVAPTGDAKPDDGRYVVTLDPRDKGAFKTPTIRDAGARPPYLHNGSEQDLEAVVELYDRGGGPLDANLDRMMLPLGLTKSEKAALVAFMRKGMASLNSEISNVKLPAVEKMPR